MIGIHGKLNPALPQHLEAIELAHHEKIIRLIRERAAQLERCWRMLIHIWFILTVLLGLCATPAAATDAGCALHYLLPVPQAMKWTIRRDLPLKAHPASADGYCDLIEDTIHLNWDPFDAPTMQAPWEIRKTIKLILSFSILRFGQLRNLAVEAPSGDPVFDESALRAVRASAPFPAFPRTFKGELISVRLGFASTEREK